MKRYLLSVSVVCLAMILGSCKEDVIPGDDTTEPVSMAKVTVQPMFGANALFLDSTYTTAEGYKVQFTDIKFYAHEVKNGSTELENAALFDFRERGTLLFKSEGDASLFSDLQFNLGVSSTDNHADPSAADGFLNISSSNDMHWSWNPGYIFVKVEAKVDTISDAIDLFDHNVVFHVGLDENLQIIDFSNLNWVDVGNDTDELQLKLDMAVFLQGATQNIDLKTEYSSHSASGQEALTLKVMENFKEALSPL